MTITKKNTLIWDTEILKEWDDERNVKEPKDYVPGSHYEAHWICSNNSEHRWTLQIRLRNKGAKCPFCTNQRVSKENNLAVLNPELAAEWHPTMNGELTPEQVVPGAGKIVWWRCSIHSTHEWSARVTDRNDGRRCPYCTNRKVCETNNLSVVNPSLAAEWHPTKNGELTPEQVTFSSGKKVWWQCHEKKHEWPASVNARKNGDVGCPYCTNQLVCSDNNLAVVFPELAAEWHPTKNGNLTPHDVVFGSGKTVWWKCKEKGHEFPNRVVARQTRGCPYCSNSLVCEDNNLAVLKPDIAAEWHPTKNGDLTPDQVTPGSEKKVWWRCSRRGHEWRTNIYHRENTTCPYCSTSSQTSFPEQAIYYYLKHFFDKVENRKKFTYKKEELEADIFIPELNIVIEYDGYYYHKNKIDKDNIKAKKFVELGYRVFAIREPGLLETENAINILMKEESKAELNSSITLLLQKIGVSKLSEIDCVRDYLQISNQYIDSKTETNHDEVVYLEWDYEKNLDLKPENYSRGSTAKVWWKCQSKGHSWPTRIAHRNNGSKCPYCTNQKVCLDNCLMTLHPDIAADWDYEKNETLTPKDVVPGSNKYAWWICSNGHSQRKMICKRVLHGCLDCKQ